MGTTIRRRRHAKLPGEKETTNGTSSSSSSMVTKTNVALIKSSNSKMKRNGEELDDGKLQDDDQDTTIPLSDTAWDVIVHHPIFWALLLLGLPYLLFLGWRYIVLQHPFLPGMRPAVGIHDRRQVLIIGSMSSGTSSMAKGLRDHVGIEVGHEDSDTQWMFVRDGTVSWFHGIRYWNHPNKNKSVGRVISDLCHVSWQFRQWSGSNNYGFGPTLFGTPQYNCSIIHPRFRKCFHHACVKALTREYGCALTSSTTTTPVDEHNHADNNANNNKRKDGCSPPFQTTLLQTRDPWRIVQSLVAKYCLQEENGGGGGEKNTEKLILSSKPPKTLWMLFHAMGLVTNETCIEQMVLYVTGYYNTILDNTRKEDIIMYPIEDTGPCEVAFLAGLGNLSTTVYGPNHDIVREACLTKETSSLEMTPIMTPQTNIINRGRIHRNDVMPHIRPELLDVLKALYQRLEYQYPE